MKLFEGKQPFTLENFTAIAKASLFTSKDFASHIFGHTFLLLCWYMMGRSHSVATIMSSHMFWDQDALTVFLPKHKSNQSGANEVHKHIYAVPSNPAICPILSLAINIFCAGMFD